MKIKLFFVLIFSFCLFSEAKSQYSIWGKITDEISGKELNGATIYISELKTGTSSNFTGQYMLQHVSKGTYLFEISLIGYKRRVERITMNSDTTINFTLSPSTTELSQVVVTAVTRSTELKESPMIIKPVDVSALNQNSSTNLIDALRNVPGVSQITTGAGISKPVIRGLGYTRVISLYNGIRQEGQQWGDEHGIEIDEYSIDRIEIVKGPGSLMYGSDGIAGVLNFISPKSPGPGKTKREFISNYQSNNNLFSYSFSHSGNLNGIQWLGRFSNKFAGNYQNRYDGKVYNSGFREFNGNLFLGVNKKWGYSHFNFSTFNTIINMVEGERDSLGNFVFLRPDGTESSANSLDLRGYQIGFPHQKVNHIRVSLSNYFILKKGNIHLDLGYQNNKRREFGDVMNPKDVALFFDLNTMNLNVRFNLDKMRGWESTFGLSSMFQINKNKGLEFLIPEYYFLDAGFFAFTQKTFASKLTLAGGIRFDNRFLVSEKLNLDSLGIPTIQADSNSTLKFEGFQKNYYGISGSLGLSYQISKSSTLKLNVSQGFRAPNMAEIGSNGKHEGTLRYEYGNPNLKSELSHQIDLAYFLNTEHVTLELTPFANFISNYIFAEKLSSVIGGDSIADPTDPAATYLFTQGNATLLGGEFYLDVHPHPLDWLHIGNSFSYVQATQIHQSDSTRFLPFIPAPKYHGELKAEIPKLGKVISHAYLKFGVDYYFSQNQYFKAYQTETATPAYTLLSAGVGAHIKALKDADFLSIYISGENLGDVAYQSHLSRLKYAPQNPINGRNGVFNMGRNFSVKLIFSF